MFIYACTTENLETILNQKKKEKEEEERKRKEKSQFRARAKHCSRFGVYSSSLFSTHIWHFLKSQIARSIISLITAFQAGREGGTTTLNIHIDCKRHFYFRNSKWWKKSIIVPRKYCVYYIKKFLSGIL